MHAQEIKSFYMRNNEIISRIIELDKQGKKQIALCSRVEHCEYLHNELLKQVEQASFSLKKEKVVCFPTETVYGIGVKASSKTAYLDLIKVKGRSPDKPISLMSDSIESVEQYLDIDRTLLFLQAFHL